MRTTLLAVLLLAPAAALAAEPPVYAASTAPITLDLVAARFAELDARIDTLRADFTQSVRSDSSDAVSRVEGDVLFRKPDLMRIEHRLPERQTVVSDGAWLWVYRPATNQVIRTRLDAWRRSEPLAKGLLDFGHSADLLRRYASAISTVSAPGADGYRSFVVVLTPKPAERASSGAGFTLTLKASTKDFFPYETELRVAGAGIRSTVANVKLNAELPKDSFRFTPPAGADVFSSPSQP